MAEKTISNSIGKAEAFLTFLALFIMVLGASVYRALEDSSFTGVYFSIEVPAVLREDLSGSRAGKSPCIRREASLSKGSYKAKDVRDALIYASKRRDKSKDCDLYSIAIDKNEVTLVTENGELEDGENLLVLDTDEEDALIAMCIYSTSNSDGCESALGKYMERGGSNLLSHLQSCEAENTRRKTINLLPDSIAKPPRPASVVINIIGSTHVVGDDNNDIEENVLPFMVNHTRAALLSLEKAGALPTGATVHFRRYSSDTSYAREILLECTERPRHTSAGEADRLEISVNFGSPRGANATIEHALITTRDCADGRRTIITVDSESVLSRDIINNVTLRLLGIIRRWSQLPPRLMLLPPVPPHHPDPDPDLSSFSIVLAPRARLGAIHPWELRVWRQIMASRLQGLLRSSLHRLSQCLSSPAADEEADAQAQAHMQLTHLNFSLISSLTETIKTANTLEQQLVTLSLCRSEEWSTPCFSSLRHSVDLCLRLLYDPALLATLYFPLEQQLSIYAPFWIPVFAPVLKALLSLLR